MSDDATAEQLAALAEYERLVGRRASAFAAYKLAESAADEQRALLKRLVGAKNIRGLLNWIEAQEAHNAPQTD